MYIIKLRDRQPFGKVAVFRAQPSHSQETTVKLYKDNDMTRVLDIDLR